MKPVSLINLGQKNKTNHSKLPPEFLVLFKKFITHTIAIQTVSSHPLLTEHFKLLIEISQKLIKIHFSPMLRGWKKTNDPKLRSRVSELLKQIDRIITRYQLNDSHHIPQRQPTIEVLSELLPYVSEFIDKQTALKEKFKAIKPSLSTDKPTIKYPNYSLHSRTRLEISAINAEDSN